MNIDPTVAKKIGGGGAIIALLAQQLWSLNATVGAQAEAIKNLQRSMRALTIESRLMRDHLVGLEATIRYTHGSFEVPQAVIDEADAALQPAAVGGKVP